MNQINLIGRLTANPELTAPKGNPVCRYRLAVDRIGTEGADFINIVSFGTRGENDAKWLTKGRLVAITGRLHHNTWTDNDGNNRERYEIISATSIFLDSRKPADSDNSTEEVKPGEEAF
ncbi:MAG: single-stranded DNA-binding protein [Acidimicrobiales bacterium]